MGSKELLKSAKTYIIFEGVLAILFGLILMLWPGLSVATFIMSIGFYGIIHGLISLVMGVFFNPKEGGLLMIFLLSLTLIISGSLTIAAGSSIKTK